MNDDLPINRSLPQKLTLQDPEVLGPGVLLTMPENAENEKPFNFGIFSIAPNTTSPVDHHQVSEIWYITEGAGKLITNENVVGIFAGEFVQIDSCIPHSIVNESSEVPIHVVFAYWS